jgi:hypothetical protein
MIAISVSLLASAPRPLLQEEGTASSSLAPLWVSEAGGRGCGGEFSDEESKIASVRRGNIVGVAITSPGTAAASVVTSSAISGTTLLLLSPYIQDTGSHKTGRSTIKMIMVFSPSSWRSSRKEMEKKLMSRSLERS